MSHTDRLRMLAALGALLAGLGALASGAPPLAPARKAPEITNSIGMKFVLIPAGRFRMGSAPGEWGRSRDEGPQRDVTITRAFLVSRGETSNAQFYRFVDDAKYDARPLNEADRQFLSYRRSPKYKNRPAGKPDHPILWVSWFSACRFCDWLSKKEGLKPVYVFVKSKAKGQPPLVKMADAYGGGYRLPTEAEWEYAARAGTTTAFSFGPDAVKFREHAYSMLLEPYFGAMRNDAVISRKPNPWGLYQMHGNVHEWCWDWYAPSYDPNQTTDPTGPRVGPYRVLRGGSMRLMPQYGRSAARMMDDPAMTRWGVGFRVVRNPVKK